MIKIRTLFIDYDTDNIDIDLPQELTFEFEDIDDVEARLPDKISDETGYCVFSCDYVITEETPTNVNTVRCNNCYWEGTEEDLITLNESNPHNHQDATLYFFKACPECKTDDYLIDI